MYAYKHTNTHTHTCQVKRLSGETVNRSFFCAAPLPNHCLSHPASIHFPSLTHTHTHTHTQTHTTVGKQTHKGTTYPPNFNQHSTPKNPSHSSLKLHTQSNIYSRFSVFADSRISLLPTNSQFGVFFNGLICVYVCVYVCVCCMFPACMFPA